MQVGSYREYLDYLQVHPAEFTRLFDTILINVTGFFRDEPAWRYLAKEIIPALVAATPREQPIRAWSAACASGQEAYTMAMLLAETLGEAEFLKRVKIYATDVDEDALATARQATYSLDEAKGIPKDLLEKYWQLNASKIAFRSDLRRCVIFERNDLVQDAPISRVDLIVSRNALMYFIPETQARILRHFNFSLNPNGFLFLGKSEMLLTYGNLFKAYSLKWRVFTKVTRDSLRDRLTFLSDTGGEVAPASPNVARLREGAAEVSPVAQIVLERDGTVAYANDAARRLFALTPGDVGRPIQDLEVSYRPLELRDGVEEVLERRARVRLGRSEYSRGGAIVTLEVDLCPLIANGDLLGVSVTFADVTELVELGERFEESRRELAGAYKELQSTIEELETTNEELQSINEELETMNEELQSTNDELEAMNDQERERSDEVDRLNTFLEATLGGLGGLGVGVVVLDNDQRVQVRNASAAELWGPRADEVTGNRRGKSFRARVRVLPLMNSSRGHFGAIVLMSDEETSDGARPSPVASGRARG